MRIKYSFCYCMVRCCEGGYVNDTAAMHVDARGIRLEGAADHHGRARTTDARRQIMLRVENGVKKVRSGFVCYLWDARLA